MSERSGEKWTPGPWELFKDGPAVQGGGQQWWITGTHPIGLTVCAVHPHGNQEANARLLLAAPELFEALEELLEEVDELLPDVAHRAKHLVRAANDARVVLAQARGE